MELLVVIAIIWIIVVSLSKINFNPQIDNQNSEMFANSIYTSIEDVRNKSLLWKWVWSWSLLSFPEKFVVTVNTINSSNNWSISWSYLSGWIKYQLSDFLVDFINQNSLIKTLTCKNIDLTNSSTWATIDLEYNKWNLTLSWCSINQKILEIETSYKWFNKTIKINSTTWVMEKY